MLPTDHEAPRVRFVAPGLRAELDQRLALGDYVIRSAEAADRDAILETHNLVFAETMPDFIPRTAREWDWAFAHNPAGMNVWIAEHASGIVAAQYAGIPLRMAFGAGYGGTEVDRTAVFSHIVDSFTHPAHRQGLKRPGLFSFTANAFIDALVWPDRVSALYGFPLPEPFRLGAKLIGYEVVRTQLQIWSWLSQALPKAEGAPVQVAEISRFDARVDALFELCLAPYAVMGRRDARWLNWRYAEHPSLRYRLFAATRGPELVGAAVYRAGVFSEIHAGLGMEWLVPPDDRPVALALLDALREAARADGCDRLTFMMAPVDPWWRPLQGVGLRVANTRYQLVSGTLSRDRRFDEDRLRARWCTTLGESDLA